MFTWALDRRQAEEERLWEVCAAMTAAARTT
jgi:hypothetical protein